MYYPSILLNECDEDFLASVIFVIPYIKSAKDSVGGSRKLLVLLMFSIVFMLIQVGGWVRKS